MTPYEWQNDFGRERARYAGGQNDDTVVMGFRAPMAGGTSV
jgi:hypothetical protein